MNAGKRTAPLAGDALLAALRDHATITLVRHDEDEAPEGQFSEPEDARWIRDQIRAGNEWAWFCAEVRAEYAGITGKDFLGACSYKSEADFREGDYYADMVTEAIADLAREIASEIERNAAFAAELASLKADPPRRKATRGRS